MQLVNFNYSNVQKHHTGGKKTMRKVHITGGKGHKSLTRYKNGKICYCGKRKLSSREILLIHDGKFIPGLFDSCKPKTRKNKH